MAGIDPSQAKLDELIDSAVFETSPGRKVASRKTRKAAKKKKRYDTKISSVVSSDDEEAFDDYGDDDEFDEDLYDDEDEDEDEEDDDDDEDDDEDDDFGVVTKAGQRAPSRSMSIDSLGDSMSRDTMSAVADVVDEPKHVTLVRVNGDRQDVNAASCLVSSGKVVDKIRYNDMKVSDFALFWLSVGDGVHDAVHAVAVCNDRMNGKKEYHEVDNTGETIVIRNTVDAQRIPWPKLSSEQARWDSLSAEESAVCNPDKMFDGFPVHSVGPDKKRRIFIMSSLFVRTRKKRIDGMKAKRDAKKVSQITEKANAPDPDPPVSNVSVLKITDTRTETVPRAPPDESFGASSKKGRIMGLLKKRKAVKKSERELGSITEENPRGEPSAAPVAKEVSGVPGRVSEPVVAAAAAAPEPVDDPVIVDVPCTPDRPTVPASTNAPPRRRAMGTSTDERSPKRQRTGYCILVYPSDAASLDRVSDMLASCSPTQLRFE